MEKIEPKPLAQNDAVARAGAACATTSTVLNRAQAAESEGGTPRVPPVARERIFQAVADLHYQPNPAAPLLQEGRTNQIGFYSQDGWLDLRVPFFAQLITGIYEACYATRHSLVLHTPPPNPTPETLYADLTSGLLDGLIVKALPSDQVVHRLAHSQLATVAVVDALPGIPSVVSDDYAGGRMIGEHLASRGHKRVFFQQSDWAHSSVNRRLDALEQESVQWGWSLEVGTVENAGPGGLCLELQAALERSPETRPTAVVCWNDRNAASVIDWCRARNWHVPGDLAVVGYDDGAGDGGEPWGTRRITSVRASWGAVAREGVYCLTALLAGEAVPNETVLPCRLITGDTT